MNSPRLILASASPRRAELLRELKLEFEVVPSEISEIHTDQLTASEAAQINAYRKARSVAKHFPDALVLGADTLVYLENRLFGKPADLSDARRMLGELQGRTHEVITGVCLIHLRAHWQKVFAEVTSVTFHRLPSTAINTYLSLVNPMDKAGAYAIQERGDDIVKEICGSYTNVVGLPLDRLQAELAARAGT
jgi:septum formation protein